MTSQKKSSLIVYILYDSIHNSIFEGQVLQPLVHKAKEENVKILLISFEKKSLSKKLLSSLQAYKNIKLYILKKYLFFGLVTLKPAIYRLHAMLKTLPEYSLYARGPHAGWISLQASKNTKCTKILIQARGILAEEYAFVHRHKKWPFSWLHALRKKHFEQLEHCTYSFKDARVPLSIEAVSTALKQYIIHYYNATPSCITIAQNDILKPIDNETLKRWRSNTRAKLGIGSTTQVYCYNGSAKAWQCPEQIILFFADELCKNNNCFLLILSQDKPQFEKLLKKYYIDPSHFYVCSIEHKKVFEYLAASDAGLLFREKNIINWVSRPTKLLEYQAAQLEIIHNNTIGVLAQNNTSPMHNI